MSDKKNRWLPAWSFQQRKTAAKIRRRGDLLRDAKEFKAAAEAYSEYLQKVPDDFDIWVQKGNCAKDAGEYVTAHAAYGMAQSIRPDDADLFMQFGHLYKLQGKFPQALASYESSAALLPCKEVLEEVKYVEALIKKTPSLTIESHDLAGQVEKERHETLPKHVSSDPQGATVIHQSRVDKKIDAPLIHGSRKVPFSASVVHQVSESSQQMAVANELMNTTRLLSRYVAPAGRN